jgi:hypothetical protein
MCGGGGGGVAKKKNDLHGRPAMNPFGLMKRKNGEGGSAYYITIKFC